MRYLILLLFLRSALFAQELSNNPDEPNIQDGRWKMTADRSGIKMNKFTPQPHRSPLDPPPSESFMDRMLLDSVRLPELRIWRDEVKEWRSAMVKFIEWATIAKKNAIRDYQKELDGPGDAAFTFTVKGGDPKLSVKGKFEISTEDAKSIILLLDKVPELDAKLNPKKQTDPRDALFK